MIEMYCDSCGTRIFKRYIRAKVKIANVKDDVDIHAYGHGRDLCNSCIIEAVKKGAAKDGV